MGESLAAYLLIYLSRSRRRAYLPGAVGENVRFEGMRNRLGRILEARIVIEDADVDIDSAVAAAVAVGEPRVHSFMALDERATVWRASTPRFGVVGRGLTASWIEASESDRTARPPPAAMPRPAAWRPATDPRPRPTLAVPFSDLIETDAERLSDALKANRLATYAKAFENAGIDSIAYLVEHSVGQLQESLSPR